MGSGKTQRTQAKSDKNPFLLLPDEMSLEHGLAPNDSDVPAPSRKRPYPIWEPTTDPGARNGEPPAKFEAHGESQRAPDSDHDKFPGGFSQV